MDNELMKILIPAIVGIISSVMTYFVAKTNSNKDLTISDRQLLSEDEKQFRAELRESINLYKNELAKARQEISELRSEVAQLHEVNLELTLENKQLQQKVDDLRTELQSFKRGESYEGESEGLDS